jgi:NADH:ubiquinone oxidoreductase subunit 6 (subunit J)
MLPLIAIATVMLAATAVAMSLRNLIHSALLLIVSWFGTAAFYLWAGAEFVAFGQVLVYVGAVSMIVLFAVLLTRRSRTDLALTPDSAARAAAGILAGLAAFSVMAFAIARTPLEVVGDGAVPSITVREIGTQLMGPHAVSLLAVGVLLTVALLGGVVIAASDSRRASRANPQSASRMPQSR